MGFETDELKNVACYADGCKEINTNLHPSFPDVAIRKQIFLLSIWISLNWISCHFVQLFSKQCCLWISHIIFKCRNLPNQIICNALITTEVKFLTGPKKKKSIIFKRQLWKYMNTKKGFKCAARKVSKHTSKTLNNTGAWIWFSKVLLKSELGATLKDAATHSFCP